MGWKANVMSLASDSEMSIDEYWFTVQVELMLKDPGYSCQRMADRPDLMHRDIAQHLQLFYSYATLY